MRLRIEAFHAPTTLAAQPKVKDKARRDFVRRCYAVPHGIGARTVEQVQDAARQHASLLAPLRNLRFVGRAASGAPFLDQIIREADAAISAIEEVTGCPRHAA